MRTTNEIITKLNEVAIQVFGGEVKFTPAEAIQPGTLVFFLTDPNHVLPENSVQENFPVDNMKLTLIKEFGIRSGIYADWINNGTKPFSRLVLFPGLSANLVSTLKEIAPKVGFFIRENGNEDEYNFVLCYNFFDGEIKRPFEKRTGVQCFWGGHSLTLYPNQKVDVNAILAEEKAETEAKAQAEATKAAEKKEYARKCGRLARKYKVPFVNVLRLGLNEEEIKFHADSLKAAQKQINAMSHNEKKRLDHEIFVCGRARKQSALKELGVYVGNGDVNHMDFTMLNFR